MSMAPFMAKRYMRIGKRNLFFSWISTLSTIGIAIGVAALIVVLSVIDGFENELRNRFLHANAHIMAYRYPAGMIKPLEWIDKIKNDFPESVKGASPFIHYETMIQNGATMQGVLIRGIHPQLRSEVQPIDEVVTPDNALSILQAEIDQTSLGSNLEPSVIIGTGLAEQIGAKIGDSVSLVAPQKKEYGTKKFKVVGIYNSGLKHYDNRLVVMSLTSAADFFDLGDTVTGLEIGLHDHLESVAITKQMEKLYRLTLREWQSFNRPLFEAMQKERILITVIVAIISIVAAFNILTTIFVSVSQKQKDISILKALGATNQQIIKLFMYQGTLMGVIGGISGGILAVVISHILERYVSKFLVLPDPYWLRTLPVHYEPTVYVSIMSAAVVLCVIASYYPARIAAKVLPTAGFRGNAGVI